MICATEQPSFHFCPKSSLRVSKSFLRPSLCCQWSHRPCLRRRSQRTSSVQQAICASGSSEPGSSVHRPPPRPPGRQRRLSLACSSARSIAPATLSPLTEQLSHDTCKRRCHCREQLARPNWPGLASPGMAGLGPQDSVHSVSGPSHLPPSAARLAALFCCINTPWHRRANIHPSYLHPSKRPAIPCAAGFCPFRAADMNAKQDIVAYFWSIIPLARM